MTQPNLAPVIRSVQNVGNILSGQLDELGREVSHVSGEVGGIKTDLATTSQEVKDLRRRFEEFIAHSERVANIQRSETKLSALKGDLEREFGHHSVVRRTSIGMLQAFDVGNVSNKTVSQVSEELMIQTPRYWLAPALVALASWSRDDKDLATVSISEAFRRDPKKTALFFALVLRRQRRLDASVRWLRQYLMALDPMHLTREFVVVLECINVGAFGPTGVALASEKLAEWNAQLRSTPSVVDAQIASWQAAMATHRQHLASNEYPVLKQLCPEWMDIQEQLQAASALPQAIAWFTQVRDADDKRSDVAEDVLDDILEQLVTEFDEEELPLRREIAYNESVIAEHGDLDKARARSDVIQAGLEETLDVVSLQTAAAMHPENLGVGVGTQRMAIDVGREDALAGIGRYTMTYRARVRPSVQIVLSSSHSGYASNFGFSGWSSSTQVPEQNAISDLSTAWNRAFASYRESVMFRPITLLVPGIIALVVTVIAFLIHPLAGVVALLGGAGVVGALYYTRKQKADATLKKLEDARDAAIGESVRQYRAASAEYVDARMVFAELDAQERPLLDIVRTWPIGQNIAVERAAS